MLQSSIMLLCKKVNVGTLEYCTLITHITLVRYICFNQVLVYIWTREIMASMTYHDVYKWTSQKHFYSLYLCFAKNAISCIFHSLLETAWFFPRILEFGTIYVTWSPKDLITCFLRFCQFHIFHFHIFSFQVTKPQNLVTLPYLSATATAEIQVGEEQVNVNVDPRSNHPTSGPLGPPWFPLVQLPPPLVQVKPCMLWAQLPPFARTRAGWQHS